MEQSDNFLPILPREVWAIIFNESSITECGYLCRVSKHALNIIEGICINFFNSFPKHEQIIRNANFEIMNKKHQYKWTPNLNFYRIAKKDELMTENYKTNIKFVFQNLQAYEIESLFSGHVSNFNFLDVMSIQIKLRMPNSDIYTKFPSKGFNEEILKYNIEDLIYPSFYIMTYPDPEKLKTNDEKTSLQNLLLLDEYATTWIDYRMDYSITAIKSMITNAIPENERSDSIQALLEKSEFTESETSGLLKHLFLIEFIMPIATTVLKSKS